MIDNGEIPADKLVQTYILGTHPVAIEVRHSTTECVVAKYEGRTVTYMRLSMKDAGRLAKVLARLYRGSTNDAET